MTEDELKYGTESNAQFKKIEQFKTDNNFRDTNSKTKNCIWCEYCEDRRPCCFSEGDYTKCRLMDFKRSDKDDPTDTYYEYNFETVLEYNVCDRFENKNLNL